MTNYISLLKKQISTLGFSKLLLINFLSGFGSFLFIKHLNDTVSSLINDHPLNLTYTITGFILIILVTIISKRIFTELLTKVSVKILWKFRKDIIASILGPNFSKLKRIKDEVHSVLLTDSTIICNSVASITIFTSSVIITISCCVYLFLVSWRMAIITVIVAALAISIYQYSYSLQNKRFESYRKLEDEFIINLNAILDGYKELFMDKRKRKVIFRDHITPIAGSSKENYVKGIIGFSNSLMIGQFFFYALIVGVVIFRVALKAEVDVMVNFIFTLIFLLTSIESIMASIPALSRADISAGKIIALKNHLDENAKPNIEEVIEVSSFERLQISKVSQNYSDEENKFKLGPISLRLNKAETVFIYGANGSGKTTFIYTILGLLRRNEGEIEFNSIKINDFNAVSYRSYFSVVFSDFHLFKINYLDFEVDEKQVDYYLKLFELNNKVSFKSGNFTSIDLSMGQKKRLALITVLLENKPILVLDEWAADQDPYFRRKFYTEIIPYLINQENKTIIAITHDDKYFHLADRLLKMEYGGIIEIKNHKNTSIF